MTLAVVPDDYDSFYTASPHLERLRARGEVRVYTTPPTGDDELIGRLGPARIVIPIRERTPLTAARLAALPELRLISMTGTGVASLDVAAATARGVLITNTPATSVSAVAELTFGLAIALLRNIPSIDGWIRHGRWPQHLGRELHGRTLGIVGLGVIGRSVARIGQAFGMRVLAWSRSLTAEAARRLDVIPRSLPELMRGADIVSLHVRASAETRGLISRELIAAMKPGALLINTARASVVDEDALYAALSEGRLGGAGLDVFGEEPLPPGHRWGKLDNVVLTSHRGFTTHETLERFMGVAVDNAIAWLDGTPQHVVNRELLPPRGPGPGP